LSRSQRDKQRKHRQSPMPKRFVSVEVHKALLRFQGLVLMGVS
jgi:hypothetical protein